VCRDFPVDGFTRAGARMCDARAMVEEPDCAASSVTCHPWACRMAMWCSVWLVCVSGLVENGPGSGGGGSVACAGQAGWWSSVGMSSMRRVPGARIGSSPTMSIRVAARWCGR
jgi:hypothetical protein